MAFKEAVSDVQTIVNDSKEALKKKEAERQARSDLQETLNHFERSIQNSMKEVQDTLIKHLGDARGPQFLSELEGLSDLVAAAGKTGEALELKELRQKVEELRLTVSGKVNEVTDLMKTAQQERKNAFAKRMGMFNKGAPEEKKKDPLVSPYDFLKREGLEDHEESLIEISEAIISLRQEGCQRAAIKRCIDHFMKYGFSEQVDVGENVP